MAPGRLMGGAEESIISSSFDIGVLVLSNETSCRLDKTISSKMRGVFRYVKL